MIAFTIGQRVDTPMGLGTVKGFEMYLQDGMAVDVFDADPQTEGSRVIVRLDDPERWAAHATHGDPYFFRAELLATNERPRPDITPLRDRWASQHDWYITSHKLTGDVYNPRFRVVGRDARSTMGLGYLEKYSELRAWAGY